MTTEILRPDGVGFATGIAFASPNVAHWQNVDEAVSDGDTTYIASTGNSGTDYYTLSASGISAGATINSVAVHYMARWGSGSAGAAVRPGLRLGGTDSDGSLAAVSSSAYTEYSQTIARPGGGSWSVSDLASLELKLVVQNSTGGQSNRVTQAWVVVDYTHEIDAPPIELEMTVDVAVAGSKTALRTVTQGLGSHIDIEYDAYKGLAEQLAVVIDVETESTRANSGELEVGLQVDFFAERVRHIQHNVGVAIDVFGYNPEKPPMTSTVKLVLYP